MKTFLWLLLFLVSLGRTVGADDHVVMVKTEDLEMNAAIDAAQRSLPVFWQAHAKPAADESEFYLKLAITDRKKTEHFWIQNVRKEKGLLVGVVANEAELVSTVKFGDEVTIDEKNISDWKFMKAGTRGGFTIAVLLKRIPPEEAAEIKKQFGWK